VPKRAAISSGPFAFVGQFLEGFELVGGMHLLAHLVFGKADFGGVIAFAHFARHREISSDLLLLRQQLQGGKASASREHFKAFAVRRPHGEVLQRAVGLDAGGKALDAGLRFPHVGGRGDKLGEGNVLHGHGSLLFGWSWLCEAKGNKQAAPRERPVCRVVTRRLSPVS
jgi:hypothetical protein